MLIKACLLACLVVVYAISFVAALTIIALLMWLWLSRIVFPLMTWLGM